MAWRETAAIGHGVEIALAPIPRSVETDGEPEIAGAAHCEAEEKSYDRGPENAHPVLTFVAGVNGAEHGGEQYGGRPEADGLCERE